MTADLESLARERGIKYFLISFSDLAGTARAKLVPASAIADMQRDGAGFAGFAAWLDMTPADPDILAVPDSSSVIQLPWKPEVAWVAADLRIDGHPLAQAPRSVLRAAMRRATEAGYELRTGVECEFFILSADGREIADVADRQTKPCYDQHALMRRYDLIAEICDAMHQLGWGPYQNDHEDANGQFEMNWQYADALTTADRHTFFKYMVRTLAEQRGLRATFMPKPFSHLTGNGCHVHVSLWDTRGTNLFADPAGKQDLSPLAAHFLGGVMHSAAALCAFTNPAVNSYRRINAPTTTSGATWSPNTITYGGNNRTHMVRIPAPGRFELRLPDGAANPYLLPAAILIVGLDGIAHGRSPGARHDENMYEASGSVDAAAKLPENLADALDAFEKSVVLTEGLGSRFTEAYLKHKRAEWRSYLGHVSPWETEHTLDC
ncbi:MAG TPA: type III glutamate--ammonia ligase [Pirellulales bacterium]|nr:type III glutamate--ammonia ligase [Pirellulales bacterium]